MPTTFLAHKACTRSIEMKTKITYLLKSLTVSATSRPFSLSSLRMRTTAAETPIVSAKTGSRYLDGGGVSGSWRGGLQEGKEGRGWEEGNGLRDYVMVAREGCCHGDGTEGYWVKRREKGG